MRIPLDFLLLYWWILWTPIFLNSDHCWSPSVLCKNGGWLYIYKTKYACQKAKYSLVSIDNFLGCGLSKGIDNLFKILARIANELLVFIRVPNIRKFRKFLNETLKKSLTILQKQLMCISLDKISISIQKLSE